MIGVTGVGLAHASVAGEDPVRRLTGRRLRYKDRATKLSLCAAREALADAGLLGDPGLLVAGETVGVVVSTNYGNVDTVCDTVATIARETYLGTSPMTLPATASNVTASWVAIQYGLRGANLTLCNGATSGLDAVHWGRLLVAAGRVDRVLVIGVEPDNPPVRRLAGGPLFDGAAALVVESVESARGRGAAVRATIGRYARLADHDAAVATVLAATAGPVTLWCPPARYSAGACPGATVQDLTARYGPSSGALGVLGCLVAVEWFASEPGPALVSTGESGDDAAAALALDTPTLEETRP